IGRERLTGLDSNLREFRSHRNLNCRGSRRWTELKDEVQVGEGIGVGQLFVDLRALDLGSRRRRRFVLKLRERKAAVAGLNLPHIIDVAWVEELGAEPCNREIGFAPDYLRDAF